jgi:negative regulator of replication initiation
MLLRSIARKAKETETDVIRTVPAAHLETAHQTAQGHQVALDPPVEALDAADLRVETAPSAQITDAVPAHRAILRRTSTTKRKRVINREIALKVLKTPEVAANLRDQERVQQLYRRR